MTASYARKSAISPIRCKPISTRSCSSANARIRSSRTCCCIPAKAQANIGRSISTPWSRKASISPITGRGWRSKASTLRLERSYDPNAGDVDLFPQEITRVLLNLISNGFYAATERKSQTNDDNYEPTLAAATKNLGDRVEIRIRDNGTGIPPEVKDKMFNPFYTTKPAGEGTGLGLSISHAVIVKQHGGSIEVDTEPGKFTEFRFVLPRAGLSLLKSGERG